MPSKYKHQKWGIQETTFHTLKTSQYMYQAPRPDSIYSLPWLKCAIFMHFWKQHDLRNRQRWNRAWQHLDKTTCQGCQDGDVCTQDQPNANTPTEFLSPSKVHVPVEYVRNSPNGWTRPQTCMHSRTTPHTKVLMSLNQTFSLYLFAWALFIICDNFLFASLEWQNMLQIFGGITKMTGHVTKM